MYPEELKAALTEMGEKPFRAGQLFSWLHKGARFEEMTNLPLSLREKLAAGGVDQPVSVRETRVSHLDGTKKFLYALRDGKFCQSYAPGKSPFADHGHGFREDNGFQ